MKKFYIVVSLAAFVALFSYLTSYSNRNGITGRTMTQTGGCSGVSCHGTANPDPQTTITITSGSGSFKVKPGSTNYFTILLVNYQGFYAGINISIKDQNGNDVGVLANIDPSLASRNGELTHAMPMLIQNNAVQWDFSWRAPNTQGTYTIRAAGCAVNNNNQADVNDQWNWMTLTEITVYNGPPILSVLDTFDFGDVHLSKQKDTTITVKNTGNNQLSVTGIEILGNNASEFSLPNGAPVFTLNPNESKILKVRFTPSFLANNKEAQINFTNNSDTNPRFVYLRGSCQYQTTAILSASESNLDFGNVRVSEFNEKTVRITNVGDKQLIINSANLSGPQKKDFSFSSPTTFNLEPDSSKDITIRFTPTATGKRDAEFNFTSNAANDQIIKLTGTGLPGPKATLTASLQSVNFGSVAVTKKKDTAIKIKNTGDSLLQVDNIQIEGSNTDDFSITAGGGSFYLQKNQERAITVSFAPNTTGFSKTAKIVFACNDPDSPEITLSGTGTTAPSPFLQLSADSIDFGDVEIDTTKDTTFTIWNFGGADLLIGGIYKLGYDTSYFSTPYLTNINIKPNDSLVVKLTFRPVITGNRTAKLAFPGNAPAPAYLGLKGRGIPVNSVEDADENKLISVYPLPAGNYTNFILKGFVNVPARLNIFNGLGELIFKADIHSEIFVWDLTDNRGKNLPAGLYFYQIENNLKDFRGKIQIIR